MLTNKDKNHEYLAGVSNQTFENFIVSDTNIKAYQDSLAFAIGSGTFPNPLVLCGPSPCGKTHLLHSIKSYIQENETDVKVSLVSFDDFISLYVEGLHKRDLSELESKYLTCDVLMIDNAQFLAGKNFTQESLSDMFYEMCLSGKRVALVSDRPSKYYKPLHSNLSGRINSFQVVDIDAPDYVIRQKYLMSIIADNSDILTENMIKYIAASKRISFSAIPGMFRKLCLFERMMGKTLTTRSIIEVIRTYEK